MGWNNVIVFCDLLSNRYVARGVVWWWMRVAEQHVVAHVLSYEGLSFTEKASMSERFHTAGDYWIMLS